MSNAMTDPGILYGTHWETLNGEKTYTVDYKSLHHVRLINMATGRRHWVSPEGLVKRYREIAS
jgi:hypothetical protein